MRAICAIQGNVTFRFFCHHTTERSGWLHSANVKHSLYRVFPHCLNRHNAWTRPNDGHLTEQSAEAFLWAIRKIPLNARKEPPKMRTPHNRSQSGVLSGQFLPRHERHPVSSLDKARAGCYLLRVMVYSPLHSPHLNICLAQSGTINKQLHAAGPTNAVTATAATAATHVPAVVHDSKLPTKRAATPARCPSVLE